MGNIPGGVMRLNAFVKGKFESSSERPEHHFLVRFGLKDK